MNCLQKLTLASELGAHNQLYDMNHAELETGKKVEEWFEPCLNHKNHTSLEGGFAERGLWETEDPFSWIIHLPLSVLWAPAIFFTFNAKIV